VGQDKITLSSPWLAGLPVGKERDERLVQELAHAVTYATAVRSIQYTTKRTITPLQRAILDEYAAWYAYGRDAELVLLRPLVEERGWDAMQDAIRLAKDVKSLSQLLEGRAEIPMDEVTVSSERAAAYVDVLLNIEREALLLGRKETFLMLQDDGWRGLQERYYWLAQEDDTLVPDKPVLVWSAQIAGDRARVVLEEPLPSVAGLPPQSLGGTVYLRLQDGDWLHASPLDGYSWSFPPPLTLSPTPVPTPTPATGRGSN
jgi:hypothetical protein